MEHQFTIRCELPYSNCDGDQILHLLASAGCTAVLVAGPGHIALEFLRHAEEAENAVLSAIADVRAALPQAKLDGAQLLGQLLKPHL